MYYGDKRESLTHICYALKARGWKIYGYHEDRSDSMTDYYDPASWDGIATKNGCVFCGDISAYNVKYYSGKEVYEYPEGQKGYYNSIDATKINQLTMLANDPAATEGEKAAALKAIERIEENTRNRQEERENNKKLLYTWPTFQENPKACNWHIEHDGIIMAKGKGAFQFASLDLKYSYDYEKMEYKKDFINRLDKNSKWDMEKLEQAEKFKTFILKLDAIANEKAAIHDGSEEEKASTGRTGYKKVVVTEYKTELTTEAIENINVDNLAEELETGMYFKLLKNFNYQKFAGNVYKIKDDTGGSIRAYRMNGKLNKELHGTATAANSFWCSFDNFRKFIANGAIALVRIIEVKTPYEVEKWVKVEEEKPKTNSTNVTAGTTGHGVILSGYTYTITEDIDTRDNSALWVLKINEKMEREEYIKVSESLKIIKGYYSKFKHGFIFRYDPSDVLSGKQTETNKKENREQQQTAAGQDKEVLKEKINKNIDSLQSKINSLSGDYKTNTWKRQNEQAGRDQKIEGWRLDIDILNYLLNILDDRELTALEVCLISNTFRDEFHPYYNRHKYYAETAPEKRNTSAQEIKYPSIMPEYDSNHWWNKEVPKKQKRLNKANIHNTNELIKAVEEYSDILKVCNKPIDRTAQKIKKLESELKMMQKGDIHFTPSNIAARLIELADIRQNDRVLEPSAGIGSIADEIKKVTNNIDVIECVYSFRELLTLKGYNIVANDFLDYQPEGCDYDCIIMNPPFSNNQDIEHIQQAYSMLAADGRLICITSPHWTFANDKKSQAFRDWLDYQPITYYLEDLESGTFEMTGVASKILVIENRAEAKQETA